MKSLERGSSVEEISEGSDLEGIWSENGKLEQEWFEGCLAETTWEKWRGRAEGTWAKETPEGSNRG